MSFVLLAGRSRRAKGGNHGRCEETFTVPASHLRPRLLARPCASAYPQKALHRNWPKVPAPASMRRRPGWEVAVSTQAGLSPSSAGSGGGRSTFDEFGTPSREGLARWCVDGLRRKIARAARDGRVDHGRTAEVHRPMTELLEAPISHAQGLEGVRRMDALVSR
jgi:hypothetical protein